jgi:hypothetical protein
MPSKSNEDSANGKGQSIGFTRGSTLPQRRRDGHSQQLPGVANQHIAEGITVSISPRHKPWTDAASDLFPFTIDQSQLLMYMINMPWPFDDLVWHNQYLHTRARIRGEDQEQDSVPFFDRFPDLDYHEDENDISVDTKVKTLVARGRIYFNMIMTYYAYVANYECWSRIRHFPIADKIAVELKYTQLRSNLRKMTPYMVHPEWFDYIVNAQNILRFEYSAGTYGIAFPMWLDPHIRYMYDVHGTDAAEKKQYMDIGINTLPMFEDIHYNTNAKYNGVSLAGLYTNSQSMIGRYLWNRVRELSAQITANFPEFLQLGSGTSHPFVEYVKNDLGCSMRVDPRELGQRIRSMKPADGNSYLSNMAYLGDLQAAPKNKYLVASTRNTAHGLNYVSPTQGSILTPDWTLTALDYTDLEDSILYTNLQDAEDAGHWQNEYEYFEVNQTDETEVNVIRAAVLDSLRDYERADWKGTHAEGTKHMRLESMAVHLDEDGDDTSDEYLWKWSLRDRIFATDVTPDGSNISRTSTLSIAEYYSRFVSDGVCAVSNKDDFVNEVRSALSSGNPPFMTRDMVEVLGCLGLRQLYRPLHNQYDHRQCGFYQCLYYGMTVSNNPITDFITESTVFLMGTQYTAAGPTIALDENVYDHLSTFHELFCFIGDAVGLNPWAHFHRNDLDIPCEIATYGKDSSGVWAFLQGSILGKARPITRTVEGPFNRMIADNTWTSGIPDMAGWDTADTESSIVEPTAYHVSARLPSHVPYKSFDAQNQQLARHSGILHEFYLAYDRIKQTVFKDVKPISTPVITISQDMGITEYLDYQTFSSEKRGVPKGKRVQVPYGVVPTRTKGPKPPKPSYSRKTGKEDKKFGGGGAVRGIGTDKPGKSFGTEPGEDRSFKSSDERTDD